MSASLPTGVVAISIDLAIEGAQRGLVEQRSLDRVAHLLLDLLDEYQLPATWTMSDPAVSTIALKVLRAGPAHEIALLGDSSWVSRDIPRKGFAHQLAHRVNRARAAGLTIATLALRSEWSENHSDLAIKHGIAAVRHSAPASRPAPPRTLPLGLWSFPVALHLPGASRWWPGGGGYRLARSIVDQAVASRGLAPLVVDVPRLAARGASAERALRGLLRHIDRRRPQGAVSVETIAAVVERLRGQYQGQPSRSILQSAA
jgi:hypothetical protein